MPKERRRVFELRWLKNGFLGRKEEGGGVLRVRPLGTGGGGWGRGG